MKLDLFTKSRTKRKSNKNLNSCEKNNDFSINTKSNNSSLRASAKKPHQQNIQKCESKNKVYIH